MNRSGVLSVQLDRQLRAAVEHRRKLMKGELGRDVRDAEITRVLLRRGLEDRVSLQDAGYVEGWRAGMAEAKEAHARALDGLRKTTREGPEAAP
jgi:hypothetical protein